MKEFVEKLIKRLEESVSFTETAKMESRVGKKQTIGFVLGVRSAVKIAKDLASEHNNGWILCEERLPDEDENRKYLVCGKNGGIYIAEFVCKSVSNNTSIGPWWSASGRYCPSPIAWQPLPAPYKKGE